MASQKNSFSNNLSDPSGQAEPKLSKTLMKLRERMLQKHESPKISTPTQEDKSQTPEKLIFKNTLCNGAVSNYVFFQKNAHPDALIISNKELGQKHTVDFHLKFTGDIQDANKMAILNKVVSMHRRVPLVLRNCKHMKIDLAQKQETLCLTDVKLADFYTDKMTNTALEDGTTIKSAIRRGLFICHPLVFSIECTTSGKHWTGLLATKEKRIDQIETKRVALIREVAPYVRRYMQMNVDAYLKESKNMSNTLYNQVRSSRHLPDSLIKDVHHHIELLEDKSLLLSAKIYTRVPLDHLNSYTEHRSFPMHQDFEYTLSALRLA